MGSQESVCPELPDECWANILQSLPVRHQASMARVSWQFRHVVAFTLSKMRRIAVDHIKSPNTLRAILADKRVSPKLLLCHAKAIPSQTWRSLDLITDFSDRLSTIRLPVSFGSAHPPKECLKSSLALEKIILEPEADSLDFFELHPDQLPTLPPSVKYLSFNRLAVFSGPFIPFESQLHQIETLLLHDIIIDLETCKSYNIFDFLPNLRQLSITRLALWIGNKQMTAFPDEMFPCEAPTKVESLLISDCPDLDFTNLILYWASPTVQTVYLTRTGTAFPTPQSLFDLVGKCPIIKKIGISPMPVYWYCRDLPIHCEMPKSWNPGQILAFGWLMIHTLCNLKSFANLDYYIKNAIMARGHSRNPALHAERIAVLYYLHRWDDAANAYNLATRKMGVPPDTIIRRYHHQTDTVLYLYHCKIACDIYRRRIDDALAEMDRIHCVRQLVVPRYAKISFSDKSRLLAKFRNQNPGGTLKIEQEYNWTIYRYIYN